MEWDDEWWKNYWMFNSKPMKIVRVNKSHASPITQLGGPHQQKLISCSKIMKFFMSYQLGLKNIGST